MKRLATSGAGDIAYRPHTVWVGDVHVCLPKYSLAITGMGMQLLINALTAKRHTVDEMCELLEVRNKQHIYNMLSRIRYHQHHLVSQRQNKWGPATYLITERLQ